MAVSPGRRLFVAFVVGVLGGWRAIALLGTKPHPGDFKHGMVCRSSHARRQGPL